MKHRTAPATVADLLGGEVVTLDLGLARVTGRINGARLVRLVERHQDGWREVSEPIVVKLVTRVLGVVEERRTRVDAGTEVDPLMGGTR